MHNNLTPCISGFTNCRGTKAHKYHPTIDEFFEKIRGGKWKHAVEKIRALKAAQDTAGHKQAKERNVPAYVLSGVCETRSGGILEHNGLLCIDLDGKDHTGLTVDDMKAKVSNLDFVAGWFVSPSGDGLKVITKIHADEKTHKNSFLIAQNIFQSKGLKVDTRCKDVRRLCIASYDPEAELRAWNDVKTLNNQRVTEVTEVTELTEVTDELYNSTIPQTRLSAVQAIENAHDLLENKEAEAKKRLKQNKKLSRLYYKHVAPYVKARGSYAGKRNEVLIDIITFLFRAVGEKNILPLTMAFYELNQSKFSGDTTMDEHKAEAEAQIVNTKLKWLNELSENEFSIIKKLTTAHSIVAFRICRDLAAIDKPGNPLGQFFLGETDLSYRLGSSSGSAKRTLNALLEHGVIKLIRKGTQYSKQVRKTKASDYKWLL